MTIDEAIDTIRLFVEEMHDNRDAVLGVDDDDMSPWIVADAFSVVKTALADDAALRAQIVTLRDALAPFVGYCVFIEHRDNDETILSGQAGRLEWRHLRTADFRRARAAYEGTQP